MSRSLRRLLLLSSVGMLVSCDVLARRVGTHGDLAGTVLETPIEKPQFVFTAADGRAFDFRKETDGKLTFLFFGYTYCPDICPVHMSNISAALDKLSGADAERVRIVFVTTDPDRDTPERLRDWLLAIDRRIVGVRPSVAEVTKLQVAVGIQPAMLLSPKPGHEGNYEVSHAAQVIAFTPDNRGRVVYPFGTRQSDWAHDIPLLLERHWSDD